MTNKKFLEALGEKIRALRIEKGLTQQELANLIGIKHRQQIVKIETGANTAIKTLRKISKVLKVSLSELVSVD